MKKLLIMTVIIFCSLQYAYCKEQNEGLWLVKKEQKTIRYKFVNTNFLSGGHRGTPSVFVVKKFFLKNTTPNDIQMPDFGVVKKLGKSDIKYGHEGIKSDLFGIDSFAFLMLGGVVFPPSLLVSVPLVVVDCLVIAPIKLTNNIKQDFEYTKYLKIPEQVTLNPGEKVTFYTIQLEKDKDILLTISIKNLDKNIYYEVKEPKYALKYKEIKRKVYKN